MGKPKKSLLEELKAIPPSKGEWTKFLTKEQASELEGVRKAIKDGTLSSGVAVMRHIIAKYSLPIGTEGLRLWLRRS